LTNFHALLQEQIRNEFSASQQYTAMAVYLDDEDIPQLAGRFCRQAAVARDVAPATPDATAPAVAGGHLQI